MSNKFLSRGKREDTGKWVTGYYVELPEDQHGKNFCLIIGLDGQYNRIIPETAGRCTDTTDKNGKRIFKGDILKRLNTKQSIIYTVDWCDDCAMFVLPCITHEELETDFTVFSGYDFEIIGNIHDNPELMNGIDKPAAENASQPVFKSAAPENFELMPG